MVIEKTAIFGHSRRLLSTVMVCAIALCLWTVNVKANESSSRFIGSVYVNDQEVTLSATIWRDAAVLFARVPTDKREHGFIPLIASTAADFEPAEITISISPDERLVRFHQTSPEPIALAEYQFGNASALTPFGTMKLLPEPTIDHLSGGVPKFAHRNLKPLARFTLF